MAKTQFTDNVTVLYAAFLHAINGTDAGSGHNHLGLDQDGSNPPITLDELSPNLQNILNDLIGLKPLIQQLYFGDKVKADIFGGFGGDGVFNGGFNLSQSSYEFTDFTVPAGTTVYVTNGFCRIRCTGNFTIEAGGTLFGQPKNQFGLGKGWYNNGGNTYNLGASRLGSAGYENVDHTDVAGLTSVRDQGGNGGCGLIIEVLGNILVNGTIACNGGNAGSPVILAGSPILGGSGGGSGGSIDMASYTAIQINGTIDCIGGYGGGGYGTNASGGGGGSGGIIRTVAPSNNALVNSFNVSGGLPGTSNGAANKQGAGGGGFGGFGGNEKQAGATGQVIQLTRDIFNPSV